MAILRNKDIIAMDIKTREEKLKELRLELVKSSVGANKATAKTKELKRAIARIHTFNTADLKKVSSELKKQ